jgi:hypothetical protein
MYENRIMKPVDIDLRRERMRENDVGDKSNDILYTHI